MTARGGAVAELIRTALAAADQLDPVERDAIYTALVADLRSRRPVGDHDPSGVVIPEKVKEELHRLVPDAEIHFERVAVLPEQIAKWNLPTRSTKRSDSRSRSFVGESVEVDAIPANDLRTLANDRIVQHIDADAYNRTLIAEEAERATLAAMISLGGAR
ncbi:MAG TPA: hypothetical protein VF469_26220 [Kofleriaceae bacterium]